VSSTTTVQVRKPWKPSTRRGWDPLEPGSLVIALVLLLIAGLLPWWGFVLDTSRVPYNSRRGTDFGVWTAEEWDLSILPGAIDRDSDSFLWWDYIRVRPESAGYGPAAAATSVLWTVSVFGCAGALVFRHKPRSRLRGWPTRVEGIAAGAILGGIVASAIGFPSAATLSFAGSSGRLAWGPGPGWFLALGAFGVLCFAAFRGWSADRSVRGLCWKCYRPVSGRTCGYCESIQ